MNVSKRQIYNTTSIDVQKPAAEFLKRLVRHFNRVGAYGKTEWTNSEVMLKIMEWWLNDWGMTVEDLARLDAEQFLEDWQRGKSTGSEKSANIPAG